MRILGLDFFNGDTATAVDRALENRGLIVAPSGSCFQRLQHDAVYREAMTNADLILPDSGFMVLLWRFLRREKITRISGLAYLNELLGRAAFRSDRSTLWVLPDDHAREIALAWLQEHGFTTTLEDCYVAPMYGGQVQDPALRDRIRAQPPTHIVIALSGGVQEKLGFYLRAQSVRPSDLRSPTSSLHQGYGSAGRPPTSSLREAPAIHCIGGALGFVTGYQVAIPNWADRLYLGWLLRLLANPRRFIPRALDAFALPGLIMRYGKELPAAEAVGGRRSEVGECKTEKRI